MLAIGRVEERVFSAFLKRAPPRNQPAVCLFVFLPRARLLNQSQSAEVALAWDCVVSVSHISGVAAADALQGKKKSEAERNEISSRVANAGNEGKKKTKSRAQTRLIILSRFLPARLRLIQISTYTY